jgi:hypothetical protein
MKKMRSTTKKAAFFTFCLYFSFLSFYSHLSHLSSFLSLLPFRQAIVSIGFNFISVCLSTFVIISLSIVFSSGQCFYSLQFYLCLSKTRMEQGGKQRCKIYISFTINFQHFKQLESHVLLLP